MKASTSGKIDPSQRGQILAQEAARIAREIELQEEELARMADTPLANEDDQAAKLPEQEKAEEILERLKQLHAQVAAARQRLAAGVYGLCEDCHEPIPPARLEALPYATHCVPCQSKHEKGRAPLGQRGNGSSSRF